MDEIVCPISHERIDGLPQDQRVTLPCCRNIFSRSGIGEWIRRNLANPHCPLCRCVIENPQTYLVNQDEPIISRSTTIRARRRSQRVSSVITTENDENGRFIPIPSAIRNYGGGGTGYVGRTAVTVVGNINNMQASILQTRRRSIKKGIIECILSLAMYGICQFGKITRMAVFSVSVMLFLAVLVNASPLVIIAAVGTMGSYILPKILRNDIKTHENVIQRHIQDVIESSMELLQIENALHQRQQQI